MKKDLKKLFKKREKEELLELKEKKKRSS